MWSRRADTTALAAALRHDGTPLELVGSKSHVPEERLAAFHDVLLGRPELDLTRPDATGRRPVIDTLRRRAEQRVR